MRVTVDFAEERFELDTPGDALIGSWRGPEGISGERLSAEFRAALERPVDFPPFRQLFVPGDRVAIALDSSFPGFGPALGVIDELLRDAGLDETAVTVVTRAGSGDALEASLPRGMALELYDPGDSRRLAYLATTKQGSRIYLDRTLTDADVVIPVGRLGYDPISGYRGPWSAVFPALGDQRAIDSTRARLPIDARERVSPLHHLEQAFEVSWLLGTQFHVGVVPGVSGPVELIAGQAESVRDRGIHAIDRHWSYHPPAEAQCVVAGIGRPGVTSGIDDLVEGLVTASRLVHQGGKIIALSRVRGPIGTSLRRLAEAGDVANAQAALRGHDSDADSVAGRQLARVLAWADVYLLSGLDREVVEDLSMVPLDHPDEARRLVAKAASVLVVSQADLTRATVHGSETGGDSGRGRF
jgi:hypothetical protein